MNCDPPPARSSGGLEVEVFEAAFVVCWPSGEHRSVSPSVEQSWSGGYISVWDSNLASDWINANCNNLLLVLIRKLKIGGPIPSMLSIKLVALTIFGNMSAYLIEIAKDLANLSGFPVIVRPLEEDPSLKFRSNELALADASDGPDQAGENGSTRTNSEAEGNSHQMPHNPRKRQEGNEGPESDDDKEDPPPPPPPSSPDSKEVIHSTDMHLTLLNEICPGAHFIGLVTKVQLCPPNTVTNAETGSQTRIKTPYEIEGHINLEIRNSNLITVDNAHGSCGFLADKLDYLRTEHLISPGYSPPQHKVKRTMGEQRSTMFGGMFGLAGGKPTALVNATKGKTTTSATEVADDEIAKQWHVYLQQIDCYWRSETSVYRGLNTMIRPYRVPTDTNPSRVCVKYGIVVEVAKPLSQTTATVSFICRHQIHCWIKSKSGIRGLIVLTANLIPDMRTDQPLCIEERLTLDTNTNIQEGPVSPSTLQPEDHFMFAAAKLPRIHPEAKSISRLRTWGKQLFKRDKDVISILMARGRRELLGWNHTNMEWFYPIWPELSKILECISDGQRIRLRLDWGGDDLEARDKPARKDAYAQTT